MTGAITMAAVGVASVAAGAYEASQANSISSSALGMAQTTQGEQMYYNNMLQQLIANPSSVSQLPGYQFQLSQGSAAVADQMSAGGFAGSGNEAAALETFGQGLASTFYGQQANLLASLSGVTSASSPAQSAGVASSAQASSSSQLSSLLNSIGFYGMLSKQNAGAAAGTPAAIGYSGGVGNPGSGTGLIGADAS